MWSCVRRRRMGSRGRRRNGNPPGCSAAPIGIGQRNRQTGDTDTDWSAGDGVERMNTVNHTIYCTIQ